MTVQERNFTLYQDAYQYLKDHSKGLTNNILEKYLECHKLESLDEVFAIAVGFVNDWYCVKRNIILYDKNNINIIKDLLHQCNLQYCIHTYTNNAEKFYNDLLKNLKLKNAGDTFTQKVIKIYVNVICSMSAFLSQFPDVQAMYNYFEKFKKSFEKIELIYEIQNASKQKRYRQENCNNEGWGFHLTANWLKDIGMQDYCKPDTHVKKFVIGSKLTNSTSNEAVFCAMINMAEDAKQNDSSANAFKADRLIWLIGSGDFYNHHGIVKYSGSMDDFLKQEQVKGVI